MITREEIMALRKEGKTYSEIGKIFGVNKSIIWKMEHWNISTMEVGNKKPISSRPLFPIWGKIDGEMFYEMVERLVSSANEDREIIKDILLRFFYSRNEKFWDKIETLPDDSKRAYLYSCGRMEIQHYFSHRKKIVTFSVAKYDYETYRDTLPTKKLY